LTTIPSLIRMIRLQYIGVKCVFTQQWVIRLA